MFEGIEVHHHQVDGLDPSLGEGLQVFGVVAPGQDPGVDRWMEGLDPSVEHLTGAGDISHLQDLDTGLDESSCGSSGREDRYLEFGQSAGEIDQSGLIADAEKSPSNRHIAPGVDRTRRRRYARVASRSAGSHFLAFFSSTSRLWARMILDLRWVGTTP